MEKGNNKEYRIPINVELSGNLNDALNQIETPEEIGGVSTDANPTQVEVPKSNLLQALNAGFLIDSTKKILSANGNTELSNQIDIGMRVGTALATAVQGDYSGILGLSLDIAAEAMMKVQELKQQAIENNNTKVNEIRLGKKLLGAGRVNVSKDYYGNMTYYTN